MRGLTTSARSPAISARRRRRISSSLLPLNIGPQTTSSQPPRSGEIRITGRECRRPPGCYVRSVSGAAEIEFRDVTKVYPGRSSPAVSHLSLTISAGEICCLVGPSGGGKTTLMKMVNRLISFDEGDILIDGRSVRDLDETELRRGIGYVIQQVGLFPHMSVAENIATVPRLLGWSRGEIAV